MGLPRWRCHPPRCRHCPCSCCLCCRTPGQPCQRCCCPCRHPLTWLLPGLPMLLLEALSTLWLPCPTPTSTTDLSPTPTVPSSLLSPLMLLPPGRHIWLLMPALRETR